MTLYKLRDDTLSLHILNVGNGDSLIVELPIETNQNNQPPIRSHLIVDCFNADKTIDYLQKLGAQDIKLVVATHPHEDHILGLKKVMEHYPNSIEQFWDSGFRHNNDAWYELIEYMKNRTNITFIRPTSGMSLLIAGVEITVIAPSIYLRNRYDTFGVNINNASIVLKLTYGGKTMILGGDAQWDSWGKITEEFPHYEKTTNPTQNIQLEETFNPLECVFLKASHHGSKHGTSLEAIERLGVNNAAISCAKNSQYGHPDALAIGAFNDIKSKIKYSYDGTIVYGIHSSGYTFVNQYNDGETTFAPAPLRG